MTAARDQSLKRIAVVKPCCIGDCVMALPALDSLRAAAPAAAIDVWVGPHSRAVFEMSSSADRIVPLDERLKARVLPALTRSLRQMSYDLIAVLDRSRLLRLAVRGVGASRVASATFRTREDRHESEVYLDVVRALRIPVTVWLPQLAPPVDVHLPSAAAGRAFVVLHPGGAQNPGVEMLDKRWPVDRWVELAREFRRRDLRMLFSGGPGDRSTAHTIASAAGIGEDAVVAGMLGIPATTAVLAQAKLFVGSDTGMSHIAAAVGTPTVAIFGPTNPRRYRPLGPHVRVVAPDASWDIGDRDLRQNAPQPPLATTTQVGVTEVLAACDALLAVAKLPR